MLIVPQTGESATSKKNSGVITPLMLGESAWQSVGKEMIRRGQSVLECRPRNEKDEKSKNNTESKC